MFALAAAIIISISVSAFCSLMEAALFAVPKAYAKHLADQGSKTGKLIFNFKENLSPPISAILILNTISHTIGAAVAGYLVGKIYGEDSVVIFSVVFTLAMLYLSEIIPKQIGAMSARSVSQLIAWPLHCLVILFSPFIKLTEMVSSLFKKGGDEPSFSEQEFLSLTEIGQTEGVLDHLEGSVIQNIIGFDRLLVKDVLTPRVVVFRLPQDRTVGEVKSEICDWAHSRVPIYPDTDQEAIESYVTQRDIYRSLLEGHEDRKLSELARPLTTVNELMRADKVMLEMFEKKESICSVVDEHGAFAGLVTVEDLVEELVGKEIIDEYDLVSDLRDYAQILYRKRKQQSAFKSSDSKDPES